MANCRSTTAFVLTLSLLCLAIAACETQQDRMATETGTGITPSPMVTMTPTTTPTTSTATGISSFDQEFMTDAARHGMMEVQLGNLAAQKASSTDVKKFGQRIATDQSKIGQMLQQLASSLNVTLPQELTPGQQQEVSKLQDLSGKQFDRDFMSLMLKDHAEDITTYERAINQVTNAELKQFASQALPILREHAELARSIAGKIGLKPMQSQ
ncbi:MAG: DUF4142 domain-containing protein [Blastocatellales bacterium]